MWERLKKLDESVRKTRDTWFRQVVDVFDRRTVDDTLWEELEELLIQADVGVETTEKLLDRTKRRVQKDHIREAQGAKQVLQEEMVGLIQDGDGSLNVGTGATGVILLVGVNGSGKTTSTAKLARLFRNQGKKVVLAAADTFRAAAIDQLKVWGDRAGVDVVAHQPGADAAAVVFDAFQAARGRRADVLIADTAGRLHTKVNLMEELKKIRRVLNREDPTAPHEVLLVLDATTGQNALSQARHFTEAVEVTGLILAKLDGTAKGGVVFAIADELKVPIKYIGTGEKIDDLTEFNATDFVNALFAGDGLERPA